MRKSSLLLAAFLAACSSKDSQVNPPPPEDSGTDTSDGAVDPLGPGPDPTVVTIAPACPGTLAADGSALKFADKSVAWDLDKDHLNVIGNHMEAADLDGDGYPDLVVHLSGDRSDPTQPLNKQLVRVLMNRPKTGGGRHFEETTVASGYGTIREGTKPPATPGLLRMSSFAVLSDVDGDGDLDAFVGAYHDASKPELDNLDRNEILLNDGKGNFKLAPISDVQKVPKEFPPPTTGATFVDVDHDGILDVWVGFWYRNYGGSNIGVQARLYKGNGDGTFTDVTVGSGLETSNSGYDKGLNHRPAYGVTGCDLDDDGFPELMVSAYGRQWNLLYKNNGGIKFSEVGQASGFAGDDNVDFSDNEFYKCYCATSKSCTTPDPPRLDCASGGWAWNPGSDDKPWRNNGNTFTTVCADLNGDGKNDLFNAEIAHWHIGQSSDKSNALFNDSTQGGLHFTRPDRKAVGLDWPHVGDSWNEGGITAAAIDLDLDGFEDIIVGGSDYDDNYSLVYRQKPEAPGTFEEIGEKIGLHHPCMNGIAVADFDRDGDLDVVVGSSGFRAWCAKFWPGQPYGNEVHLYENALNDGAAKRGFLQIALDGKGKGFSNRTGVGARVKVVANGKVITKELLGGYGQSGLQSDTVLTFGLGATCTPDAIEVRWPDGALTRTRYKGVGGGRRVLIQEGGTVTDSPPK